MTQQYNAAYTEGAVCAGGVLKSVFTKDRACGHLSFQKRLALLNVEESRGESQVDCFRIARSIEMRERSMLGRLSHVNTTCVCSWMLCMYLCIFKFSPKVFTNRVGNYACF